MNIASLIDSNPFSLAERYRQGDPEVIELFGLHPSQEEHWARRALLLDETSERRASLEQVALAIRTYQSKLPYYSEAAASLEKLEQSRTLVVVGGQQAGLFGGALLIYYKALSVVQTAREAEKRLGRPVVPVFWIAGEDHDFDEANHVNIQSPKGGIRRIRIERPEGPRLAVSRTPLTTQQWETALQELADQLPDSEFKPALLERLQSHITDCPSLSLAFARLLADWFGREGLLLLDADDPNLRALEGPMFRELIVRNNELETALKAGESQVLSKGFKLQAETNPGSANLFLHHEHGRLLLHKEKDRFIDRRGHVSYSQEQMLELTSNSPDCLSTNALTRPLMQDYLLPVLAAVLGPSELAYWGILGPTFHEFGMSVPLLIPRQSFTYLEPNVTKLLDKYSLSVEEAITDWEQKKSEWLAEQDEWNLEEKFRLAKRQFEELYAPVIDTVSSLQPGLATLAATNRDKILEQITYLESRSLDAIAKQHEASLRQWDRIHQSLSPLDKPQERIYGTVHFWNRYGPEWLVRWLEVPYQATGGQRLVESLTNS
ncbi:bacillithiol biosynthesis cysteine-adding enzyme BshC [Cohnella silvisoli]|uniref:Putative cysteine ligase BshC n=1 Tax=Cohnella silvisoli TaxID=2873699 RepID=A0ABV1KYL3_9BACL|nr:bacillithiol biosynthesis cysteine-adding enzyme BshC [Cohnella silvisoli]MCD9024447.1 bacillithiol biosynthesis cysteine-adding enzyme BshC [Cohnella silvisoli]